MQLDPAHAPVPAIWGRVIFWVADVDAMYERALAPTATTPEMAPADAPWGERYFHLRDPDGHELSFARLLRRRRTAGQRQGVATVRRVPVGVGERRGRSGCVRMPAPVPKVPRDDVVEVGGLAGTPDAGRGRARTPTGGGGRRAACG